jgi:hypothetical protein
MPYEINVERRKSYLYITVTGDNTLEDVRRYLSDVLELILKYKCPNLLIVENLEGPGLGIYNIYDLASSKAAQALPFVSRMAFVDLNPAHTRADREFAENVAVNRGLTAKFCESLQAAEEWLEQQANPEG